MNQNTKILHGGNLPMKIFNKLMEEITTERAYTALETLCIYFLIIIVFYYILIDALKI